MNEFEFIDAEKAQYPIGLLCKALDVSRPGYYAHTRRTPSKHATRDAALGAKIAAVHASSGKRYGSPRVHDELREEGERVSRKRVARIMKERDLRGRRRRRFRVTTQSEHDLPIAPNVLARDFSASAPNQKWVGDITYIWTREGWLYLAVLIDLFSRRVVGWSMSDSLATDLPLRALHMAIQTRRPPRGLIHHTDRGCQYASAEYRAVLEQHGIVASMRRERVSMYRNVRTQQTRAPLTRSCMRHYSPRVGATHAFGTARVCCSVGGLARTEKPLTTVVW